MDTNSIMMMVQDKLPKNPAEQMALRDKLDKMSEAKKDELVQKLPTLKLKSPAFVFWVGAFLFGQFAVARFMIGDKREGIIRLCLAVFIPILIVLLAMATGVEDIMIVASISYAIAWLWAFIDLFYIFRDTRRSNISKILQAIG